MTAPNSLWGGNDGVSPGPGETFSPHLSSTDLGVMSTGAAFTDTLFRGFAARAAAKASNRVTAAQVAYRNALRAAANNQRATEATAGRAVAAINNDRMTRNNARVSAALGTTMLRLQQAGARADFESSVNTARQAGALYASAAASGIFGNSVDRLDYTLRLQSAREAQYAHEALNQQVGDLAGQQEVAKQNMITQQQSLFGFDHVDNSYEIFIPQHEASVSDIATQAISAGVQQAAQVFGGMGG